MQFQQLESLVFTRANEVVEVHMQRYVCGIRVAKFNALDGGVSVSDSLSVPACLS